MENSAVAYRNRQRGVCWHCGRRGVIGSMMTSEGRSLAAACNRDNQAISSMAKRHGRHRKTDDDHLTAQRMGELC